MTGGSIEMPLWYTEGLATVFEPCNPEDINCPRIFKKNIQEEGNTLTYAISSYRLGVYIMDRQLLGSSSKRITEETITKADLMGLARSVGNGEDWWTAFGDLTGLSEAEFEENINKQFCDFFIFDLSFESRHDSIIRVPQLADTISYQNSPDNTLIVCSTPTPILFIGNWNLRAETHNEYNESLVI